METQEQIKDLKHAARENRKHQNLYGRTGRGDTEGQELGLSKIRDKAVHDVALAFFFGLSIMAAITIVVIFWHTLTPSHWHWLDEGHVLIETRSSMVGASIGSLVSMLVSRFFRST